MTRAARATLATGTVYTLVGLALSGAEFAASGFGDDRPHGSANLVLGVVDAVGTLSLLTAWRMGRGDLWAYPAAAVLAVAMWGSTFAVAAADEHQLSVPCLLLLPYLYLTYACGVALADVRDVVRSRRRERLYRQPLVRESPAASSPSVRLPPRPGERVRSRPRP